MGWVELDAALDGSAQADERLRGSKKILCCRSIAGSLYVGTRVSMIARSAMSVGRHNPNRPLTLVSGSTTPAWSKSVHGEDWSTLMGRTQGGDRQAYRALLEAITPYIRSLAGRCFKQPTDVEDAVQDVLLTIHMVRHAYDPRRPFGPWLVAIAHRRIIDRLRRDIRRKTREVALAADHETFADASTNLDGGSPDELALIRAIDRLPPEQRQTITMLKLNEMSLQEASAASGRSVVALKVATHRAMKRLRRMLRRSDRP
jgi:RNA polymerase sigma-70 factor (ECF subfamily)